MKEFVHRPYEKGQTIAAIATPPGEGGIGIIRISGSRAVEIADAVFSGNVPSYKTHTLHFGKVCNEHDEVVDEVLLAVMRGPHSFTGEDVVEIHCHGGRLITKNVLEAVVKAGALPALPGEFSFQAFQNGKVDLAQAEAIQEVIGAKNETALRLAEQQLSGLLSKTITSFQKQLTEIAAILEAWVDFPEEGIEFASKEELISSLDAVIVEMDGLISTYSHGKIAHDGLSLCLAGPPNVGKSSLMNRLLRKERAIVTDIAGTTRDLLEDDLRFGDLHFRLIDTAGIRDSNERIEQEGIVRSKKTMGEADIVLLVLDASVPLDAASKDLLDAADPSKTLLVWNKMDLPRDHTLSSPLLHAVTLSAKTGEGIAMLQEVISKMVWNGAMPSKEELVISNVRHEQALVQARNALHAVKEGLAQDISPEFLSADMRAALVELGTIIGTNISEEILSSIFSKFCIGK